MGLLNDSANCTRGWVGTRFLLRRPIARCLLQDAMAERLQLMADHGMTRDKLEQCVKTEGVCGNMFCRFTPFMGACRIGTDPPCS